MGYCCAIGCRNRTDRNKKKKGVGFHRFPKDEILRKRWIKAVRRKNWEPTEHSLVCTEHFSEKHVNRTYSSGPKLRENAVPSVFPGIKEPLKKAIKRGRRRTVVDIDVIGGTDEDEGNAVKVKPSLTITTRKQFVEMNGTEAEETKKPEKKKMTIVREKHLLFNARLMPPNELEIVKKAKLPPSIIYRLIVPVPPEGELNTEKIVKQMISGLPQIKQALASEPAEPPPLVPMSSTKATNPVPNGAPARKKKSLPAKSPVPVGTPSECTVPIDTRLECPVPIDTQPECSVPIDTYIECEGPTILTSADAINQCDGSLSAVVPELKPAKVRKTRTPSSRTEMEDARETSPDQLDGLLSAHSTSDNDLKIYEYQRKIKNLQGQLRRMSSKMDIMSDQLKTVLAHEAMRNTQKSSTDNIIVVHTAQPMKNKEKVTRPPKENINKILMGAVNREVPPPAESKYMVANFEKLVSRVTSIKETLKNKEVVNCFVIQTEDLRAKV